MTEKTETIARNFNELVKIAHQFQPDAQITDIQQYGSGNINSTFLVTVDFLPPFILQRQN